MITLCVYCHTVLKIDLTATSGLSHGLCLDCVPRLFREDGWTEEEVNDYMEKHRLKEENK